MIAGVLSFIDLTKKSNVQGFQHVSFLIKVEKEQEKDNQAILFFMDGNPVKDCNIVSQDIECYETNEHGQTREKNLFCSQNFFLNSWKTRKNQVES